MYPVVSSFCKILTSVPWESCLLESDHEGSLKLNATPVSNLKHVVFELLLPIGTPESSTNLGSLCFSLALVVVLTVFFAPLHILYPLSYLILIILKFCLCLLFLSYFI